MSPRKKDGGIWSKLFPKYGSVNDEDYPYQPLQLQKETNKESDDMSMNEIDAVFENALNIELNETHTEDLYRKSNEQLPIQKIHRDNLKEQEEKIKKELLETQDMLDFLDNKEKQLINVLCSIQTAINFLDSSEIPAYPKNTHKTEVIEPKETDEFPLVIEEENND